MSELLFPVSEHFGPTLAGEANLVGLRTLFCRFAYCDGAGGDAGWCKWCDSLHSVDPKNKDNWQMLSAEDIVMKLMSLSSACRNVTLSGGNPALYKLDELVDLLHDNDFSINIETQGTVFRSWIAKLDNITVSPKPPSAGNDAVEGLTRFSDWLEQLEDALIYYKSVESTPVCVKVPVDVNGLLYEEDYAFARRAFAIAQRRNRLWVEPYLSIVTYPSDSTEDVLQKWRTLAAKLCSDNDFPDCALVPQGHVLLWSHALGV